MPQSEEMIGSKFGTSNVVHRGGAEAVAAAIPVQ